jgi:hypothetical protein
LRRRTAFATTAPATAATTATETAALARRGIAGAFCWCGTIGCRRLIGTRRSFRAWTARTAGTIRTRTAITAGLTIGTRRTLGA